jgi:cob(I)alamin adenosyltransferase
MYTGRGDNGETSLYGPKRVQKDSPRVEAYGAIDELNSVLGVVIAGTKDRSMASALKKVQNMLFVAGADAATELKDSRRVPRITPGETTELERMTKDLLARLPSLKSFILPGGTSTGALLQLARAVCRRTERRLLTASKAEEMNPALLPFFNRLSSYLFNLSREVNRKAGVKEEIWKSDISANLKGRGERFHPKVAKSLP